MKRDGAKTVPSEKDAGEDLGKNSEGVGADTAAFATLVGLVDRTKGDALPLSEKDFRTFYLTNPPAPGSVPPGWIAAGLVKARANIQANGDYLVDMSDGRGLRRASEVIEELSDPDRAEVLVAHFQREMQKCH